MIDYLLSLVREGKLTYEYVSVRFGLALILSFTEKWTKHVMIAIFWRLSM